MAHGFLQQRKHVPSMKLNLSSLIWLVDNHHHSFEPSCLRLPLELLAGVFCDEFLEASSSHSLLKPNNRGLIVIYDVLRFHVLLLITHVVNVYLNHVVMDDLLEEI